MKKFVSLMLALIMVLSLVACGGDKPTSTPTNPSNPSNPTEPSKPSEPGSSAAKPQEVSYKKNLVIADSSKMTTMDPQKTSNAIHDILYNLVFNQLVNFSYATGEIEPELATEWSVSDDALTWTFKLRKDVTFSNGEPMTADDVVFTFERAKETGTSNAADVTQIESVTASDDYTVVMKMASANMDWLYTMALCRNAILNREACAADPEKGHEIGTGGWKVESWASGDYAKFVQNEKSWVWDGKPTPTETITVKTMAEASARVIAVQTGEVDYTDGPEIDSIPVLQADKKVKVEISDAETISFLGFNSDSVKGSDINLRKAISYAINREEMSLLVDGGYATPCKTLWGRNQYGYYDNYSDPQEYNLDKAKEYLAKSNYPNGTSIEILGVNAYDRNAEVIQEQLKALNIDVTVTSIDSAGLSARVKAKDYEAYFYNKTTAPDGTNLNNLLNYGHNTNRGHYKNERVMELLKLAMKETNDAQRKAYYQEVQQITHDEMPYVPMYYGTLISVYGANVSGVIRNPNYKHDFTHIVCTK